jgi:glycosyltransferase involved in cell wall biosynthesis
MSNDDASGSFVAAHCNMLQRDGCAIDIIAAQSRFTTGPLDAPIAATRISDDQLFRVGGAPDALEQQHRLWLRAGQFSLRLGATVLSRKTQWDAVISHWLVPCALAALPTRGPFLAIAHGGDIHLLQRTHLLSVTIAALLLRRAKLVFVNDDILSLARDATPAFLHRRFDVSSAVIPMGVNLLRFEAVANARWQRPIYSPVNRTERINIVTVGRLVEIKGIDVAIAALATIDVPVHLTIVGDGPLALPLQQQATALVAAHPRHHIMFHGYLAPKQRDRILAQSDLAVIPSRSLPNAREEGMPQVALEALAAGIPLVVTQTGGMAKLPQPVLSCRPNDAPALAQTITNAIAHMLTSSVSQQCQNLARLYGWDEIYHRLNQHWLS